MITTDLMEKAGGREKAAELCRVSLWATYKWDEEGIPSKHWRTFANATGLSLEQIAQVEPSKVKTPDPGTPAGPNEGAAA